MSLFDIGDIGIWNESSPLHGLSYGHFSHLCQKDKDTILGLIARCCEQSFRRGFQQGWDSKSRGDKVCDLHDWRFSTGLSVSVSAHDTYHTPSECRAISECGLPDVGIGAWGYHKALTAELIQSHVAKLLVS